jgi:hypothetical protein
MHIHVDSHTGYIATNQYKKGDPSNLERNELIKRGINRELLKDLDNKQISELLSALLYLIIQKHTAMNKASWVPLL